LRTFCTCTLAYLRFVPCLPSPHIISPPLHFAQYLSPKACYRFTDGLYNPMIHLQVIDRYGRASNVVSKKLVVTTAILLYASDMPVVIDNGVAFTSLSIQQNTFDPIHDLVNVTGTR